MNKKLLSSGYHHSKWNFISRIMNYRSCFKRWNFVRTNLSELCEMTLESLLDHEVGSILFYKYIKTNRANSKRDIMRMWRAYRLCKTILIDLSLLTNPSTLDQLFSLRPPFILANELINEMQYFNTNRDEKRLENS